MNSTLISEAGPRDGLQSANTTMSTADSLLTGDLVVMPEAMAVAIGVATANARPGWRASRTA